jgi:hypothetical protein
MLIGICNGIGFEAEWAVGGAGELGVGVEFALEK